MLYAVAMPKKGSLGSDTVSIFLSLLVYTCDLLVLIITVRPVQRIALSVSFVNTFDGWSYRLISIVYYGRYSTPASYWCPTIKLGNLCNVSINICKGDEVHQLMLQGTLPSNPKCPTHKRMWRGVTIACALIAMCFLPLAIGGFWAFGNKVRANYVLI